MDAKTDTVIKQATIAALRGTVTECREGFVALDLGDNKTCAARVVVKATSQEWVVELFMRNGDLAAWDRATLSDVDALLVQLSTRIEWEDDSPQTCCLR